MFGLAAYIKKLGKKSIVTAGATQLLFGIKGARWDNAETPVPYNDNWIRPKESERCQFIVYTLFTELLSQVSST